MDEKQARSSMGVLNTAKRWTLVFAASLCVMTPLSAAADERDNVNENQSLAVQQAKKSITGTVLDNNGEPVVGATVVEKGVPNNGTITNLDGKFTLSIKPGAQINVTYVGFKPQTVAVKGNTVTVRLEEDSESLDEVVVVAYGTQKKKDLTGSMTSVKAENGTEHHHRITCPGGCRSRYPCGFGRRPAGLRYGHPHPWCELHQRCFGLGAHRGRRCGPADQLYLREPLVAAQPRGHRLYLRAQGCRLYGTLWFARCQRRGAHHHQARTERQGQDIV